MNDLKPTTPQARRGTKPGATVSKDFEHVCPAEGCPRNGEPFKGTAKAVACSPRCNLKLWRDRKKAEKEADA